MKLYTDGACSGNPGCGGWAWAIIDDDDNLIKSASGFDPYTTNNKMELTACIEGLKQLIREDVLTVEVITDSIYVQKGITEWIFGWKKKNWHDVKNKELWFVLDNISEKMNIKWSWVKGHNGNKYNELCDTLATDEIKKAKVNEEPKLGLKEGSLFDD